ncbi:zf-HC2 domain-containing protein [Jiangella gansuensis]|uniref:zf-HC2 domain-containing protein n=1 Tax=Jiangella gansuensis TaxID=281473 RepID=UPI00047D1F37|nr:zf-HC2 domain-containing protein [Jiangella gansuensis]
MVEPTRCGDIADALAEVATGAASGPDRARVLSHLAGCPDCRRELEELTKVADDVLLVAPQHDPPAGFEGAVLARIAADPGTEPAAVTSLRPPRRWPLLAAAAAVAVAGAVGAGIAWQSGSDDRDLAASYRDTLEVANGRYFHAAPIQDPDGAQVGHVFLYQGEPSWVFTVLDGSVPAGTYDVIVATGEETESVARYEVSDDGGGTGATVEYDIRDIERIELVAADGTVFAADLAD